MYKIVLDIDSSQANIVLILVYTSKHTYAVIDIQPPADHSEIHD